MDNWLDDDNEPSSPMIDSGDGDGGGGYNGNYFSDEEYKYYHDMMKTLDASKSDLSWSGISGLKIHNSSGDGNCFFTSMVQILNSIGIHTSVANLRKVAVKQVLNPNDDVMNSTIQNWLELYKSFHKEKNVQFLVEYSHLRGLESATWPLTMENRQRLFANMNQSSYWADESCLRAIEEACQLRSLIFDEDTRMPRLNWYHRLHYAPTHFAMLQFVNSKHYNAVSLNGKFIFLWNEFSSDIQRFFHQSFKKVDGVKH